MTDQLWVVRAGERARHADAFRSGPFIAIGFEDFFPGDLGSVTEPELRRRASDPAQSNSASQLAAFAYHLDVGDYVIVPLLPKERSYLVGQVTGPYMHVVPPPGPDLIGGPWRGSARFPARDYPAQRRTRWALSRRSSGQRPSRLNCAR